MSPERADGRVARDQYRRRRRRRRAMRALSRGVIWFLVVSAVFVLGVGFGRTIASDSPQNLRKTIRVTNNRGAITATLPTTTVTTTVTVTKTVKAKPARTQRKAR